MNSYANQIGVGKNGDLPGEIKFQYGAAVLHGSALTQSHYAIYGSLFVLVPDDDPYRFAHLSAVSGQRRRAERWPPCSLSKAKRSTSSCI